MLVLIEYRESGEDVSGNTVWVLRDWGNTAQSPEAKPTGEGGITSISKDEDGIPRYVQARLTVITLLLSRLEATNYLEGESKKSRHLQKLAISKKSTILVQSSWYLGIMKYSWDNYFDQVSWG